MVEQQLRAAERALDELIHALEPSPEWRTSSLLGMMEEACNAVKFYTFHARRFKEDEKKAPDAAQG